MAIEQDMTPLNSEMMDSLAATTQMDWINYEPGAAMKVLWTGAESGRWAVLFKWDKGYTAGQHKHLSAAYTFILKGSLQVRDSVLNPGDFIYEPNGIIHGKTTAVEDTEFFFMCDGPVLFFDDNGFNGYLGWEELERLQESAQT